jgi:hypothetical protein
MKIVINSARLLREFLLVKYGCEHVIALGAKKFRFNFYNYEGVDGEIFN